MKKTIKRFTALILTMAMVMTTSAFSFADTNTNTNTNYSLADGDYTVNVTTDSTMFHIAIDDKNTCKLTAEKGVMTAVIRLNGTGFDNLYLGTAEEAGKAEETTWIKYVLDDEEYYTFKVPVSSFDNEIKVAARSHKYEKWYDHTLTFTYNTPTKTTLKSLKAGTKSVKVTWNKQTSNTSGYQLRYATNSSLKNPKTVRITKNSLVTKTINNLKTGKKYYLQVRTYKKVDGKYYYSTWSSKKSVKVK